MTPRVEPSRWGGTKSSKNRGGDLYIANFIFLVELLTHHRDRAPKDIHESIKKLEAKVKGQVDGD